jgi:deazaflavin-dependent oxidoreductase (nitroreductase family)
MKLPMFLVRLMNPAVAWLLRSRLHGITSKTVMLITFTGRKSGKRYTTPISYVRDGERVRVFTVFPWWRNMRNGEEVTVLIAGVEYRGNATAVTGDAERIPEALRDFLKRVPLDKAYYNRGPDGQWDGTSNLDGKVVPVVLVEIQLQQ